MALPAVFFSIAGLGPFVHSSVQSIYAYRLYKLTGYWVFPTVCWALSAYILGSGIVYMNVKSELSVGPRLQLSVTKWDWLVYFHFLVDAGVDILIAIFTCWYLARKCSRGLKSTRRLVNRIMLRVVQTGVITSVAAVGVFILYLTSNSSAWLGLYLPLTPLYPITLLTLLNGRVGVNESSATQTVEIPLESGARIHTDDDTGMKSPTRE